MKIGLALGAGAARGLAHIGVLQVFEEKNIPVDILAGTSMGAVIGGLYASGVDLNILAKMAGELDWNDLARFTITRYGLVSSERIFSILKVLTKEKTFEELPIPTAVVAADINSGMEVVLKSGSVAHGIRASLSIPGIFIPVEHGRYLLVDGALVNRVPCSVCRDLGADYVIGVDVGHSPIRGRVGNLPDVIMRTIEILDRQCSMFRPDVSDIRVTPQLGNVTATQLNRAEEIIEAGRIAALEVVDVIKAQIGEKGRRRR